MTDKQKQAILAINRAKEAGCMEEEDYLLLLEFIYVPPISTPILPMRSWEGPWPWEGPWVTYQTTSTFIGKNQTTSTLDGKKSPFSE